MPGVVQREQARVARQVHERVLAQHAEAHHPDAGDRDAFELQPAPHHARSLDRTEPVDHDVVAVAVRCAGSRGRARAPCRSRSRRDRRAGSPGCAAPRAGRPGRRRSPARRCPSSRTAGRGSTSRSTAGRGSTARRRRCPRAGTGRTPSAAGRTPRRSSGTGCPSSTRRLVGVVGDAEEPLLDGHSGHGLDVSSQGTDQIGALAPDPVGVAQLALVELAVGVARHRVGEVDPTRATCSGRACPRSARGDRPRAASDGSTPAAGSTTAFTSSPQSSWGMPNTATSPTAGCDSKRRLDLGRVDVHAAGDDHVDLAVAEVQVAVVVELAHVADGEVVAVAVGRGLLGIALVRELAHELQVDGADGARRHLVAVVVEDLHVGTEPRSARRCRDARATPRAAPACRRPRSRRRTRRSPGRATSNIRRLSSTGHGAAAWITCRSDDTSYFARTSSGSAMSRCSWVGTIATSVTPVLVDQLQRALGVPLAP